MTIDASYEARKTAKSVGILSIGQEGSEVNLLGVFRAASDAGSIPLIDLTAVNDKSKSFSAGPATETLEVEVVGTGADLLTAFDAKAYSYGCKYTHDLDGSATTGSAIISAWRRDSGGVDGAQRVSFTLTRTEH